MTSCALGLCLFTFITKLRICDNAHPLSRNSSSDVNVDSMTCCSYHLRKSAYRYISMFLVFILLISRLLFIANLLNAMFIFTVSFYSVLHMLEHYFSPKTAATQYNPHWPRRPSIYDFQTRHQSLAIADERSFVATRVLAIRVLATTDCLFNGEAQTFCTTKFFEPLDAACCIVAAMLPTLHQSNLAALLQQLAFHSLMIFHLFFYSL